ncbi:hypothetical protein CHUAL_003123 [Chamberlinius hualienensis]
MLRPPWCNSCKQYFSDGAKAFAVKEPITTADEIVEGKSKRCVINKENNSLLFHHRPTSSVIEVINGNKQEGNINLEAKDVSQLILKRIGEENNQQKATNLVDAIKPSDLDCYKQEISLKELPKYYLMLSKFRLTGLVVATEIVGYAMAPGVFDPKIFLLAATGTALLSSAANTVNQFFEVPFDSQMARTKNRVLVRAVITPLHAATFAMTCVATGLTMLHFGVNGLTAGLGAVNLLLYTSIYTPSKRMSIINTWLGSIVGAIPPIMGWTACTGTFDAGALVLGGILYAWQFPHFNALSWNLRGDYSRAGYRMMCVTNPELCRRTTLRYSIILTALCSAAPFADLTTITFALDSLPFNAYLIYLSYKFYKDSDGKSSRKLFRFSLIHLPAIMMLMIISKKHYGKKEEAVPVT